MPRRFPILAVVIGVATLVFQNAAKADEPAGKRVENRGTPVDSSPQPAGAKPSPSGGSASGGSQEKCETAHKTVEEQTTTVEEVQVIETQETIIIEVPQVVGELPSYSIFEEVLQNTIGRPKATSVIACTDPRNPLPSYAFVGMLPQFSYASAGDTVRLQRLEIETEVDPAWLPADSIFTIVAGSSRLRVSLSGPNRSETVFARDALSGRTFP
jgi:hypothetical protein